jgi:pyruvate,water dikinase
MKFIIPIKHMSSNDVGRAGGKAYALAVMTQKGLNVPEAITITTEAYDAYVTATGLRTKIMMELNRKSYDDTRWEELWDLSLRIRNIFANTPLPRELYNTIKESVESHFSGKSVVVRSSAPGEDTAGTSFAGLHASYVNVKGTESVMGHINLVWASLWSDASLLYRKEIGLDESKSSMAVVVQEIITGDVSGVAFGLNPNDPSQCVIESVYGLNQGLVDGTLEPDRWILDRKDGSIISHAKAERIQALYPSEGGTALAPLPLELKGRPPLTEDDVRELYRFVMKAEEILGLPQDMEFTVKDNTIHLLQSRPITTLSGGEKNDKRGWYLSLTKSFENLRTMRHTIEEDLIPRLQKETEDLAETDIPHMSDGDITAEAARRKDIFLKWKKIYWDYFIPFAHGMRLFGTVYNDTMHPEDPYEFLSLLSQGKNMTSIQRNDILQEMASHVQNNSRLARNLKDGDYTDAAFNSLLQEFIGSHGDLLCQSPLCKDEMPDIINMIIEMASSHIKATTGDEELQRKEQVFLSHFEGNKREEASEMLDIGRASYAMRDNDKELTKRSGTFEKGPVLADHFDSVSLEDHQPEQKSTYQNTEADFRMQDRQITGQPAGPGIATGPAHVINSASDLMRFKKGEVLVCDSIDPNMTFAVPLASAIVERRGGMLIHGAIIAREYGLPCVTGIKNAAEVIKTGDRITVDGYLGIVVIDASSDLTEESR